jgi:hypothetical protein
VARRLKKVDAVFNHACMIAGKIIGLEKQHDPAAGLVSDCGALLFAIGAGEEEARALATRRGDDDPPLAPAQGRVLQQREAKPVA